jgi:hypothetical protein
MVIDDFHLKDMPAFELEAQTPLVVDADTPLPGTITLQWLKVVRRWLSQVVEYCRAIKLIQPLQSAQHDVLRQTPRLIRNKQPLSFLVGERSDHSPIVNMLFMGRKTEGVRHG